MARRTSTLVLAAVGLIVLLALAAPPRPALAAYTPPTVKVAVVRSQVSQDWWDTYRAGSDILGRQDAVESYLRTSGWDVSRIVDADLGNLTTLKQYDVIVLQNVFAMTPTAANNVTRYVAEGGGVVNLMASPRVAPGYVGTESGDHWFLILGNRTMEWGPLTEAYQMVFIDDMGPFNFHTRPVAGHPVVTGAQQILQARGYSSADMDVWRDAGSASYRNGYAWIELSDELAGNRNVTRFLDLVPDTQPSGSAAPGGYKSNDYPGTHSGAVASRYLKGRAVYFGFGTAEMLPTMNWYGLAAQPTKTSGVPQGQVVGAYVESAVAWAAGDGGVGPIVRDGRTYASCDVYRDGIYASQYVQNKGNVSVTGTLYFRVYGPSGAKVYEAPPRYRISIEPGGSLRYSQRYVTSRLADGVYRVEVEYVTTYPRYERHYVESLRVRRSAGKGLRTAKDTARTRGRYCEDPRIVRLAGTNRYATALAIADASGGYPRPGGYVVVASGDAGADALVAAGIAGAVDAPVVLTERDALPASVDTWLRDPSKGLLKAIVVGGTGAVSTGVADRLEAIFGEGNVTRLAGEDRYSTAATVAVEVRARLGDGYDGGMIVANGAALADAAGAAAASAALGRPLLLVRRDEVPTVTAEAISALVTGTTAPELWIAGGTGVVSNGTEAAVESAAGTAAVRAAGLDRYDTAARLADMAASRGCGWVEVGLASGVNLADALCLGPHIGRMGGVMLLSPGPSLSTPTRTRVSAHKSALSHVWVGGGGGVVSEEVIAEASSLLP